LELLQMFVWVGRARSTCQLMFILKFTAEVLVHFRSTDSVLMIGVGAARHAAPRPTKAIKNPHPLKGWLPNSPDSFNVSM
jgi:hypothetical protein